MAVKVTLRESAAGQYLTETYENATSYYAKDGHLFVTRREGGNDVNVAVFVEATWIRAEVDPK
jgi:hypothetical protein